MCKHIFESITDFYVYIKDIEISIRGTSYHTLIHSQCSMLILKISLYFHQSIDCLCATYKKELSVTCFCGIFSLCELYCDVVCFFFF